MSAKTTPKSKKPTSAETVQKVFFMATVEAVWRQEPEDETSTGSVKNRKINILLEHDSIHLAKKDLDEINRGVFQRLKNESNVDPNQVADIVLLNICILGQMTPNQFYGNMPKQAH